MENAEKKKKITISMPCYNEMENIPILMDRLTPVIDSLSYDVEVVFTDNCSTDGTVDVLRKYAEKDRRIKVLVNRRNYGITGRSGMNSRRYYTGDAIISMASDLQDPPEMIPDFIKYWEQGYKVVCGKKTGSKEGRIKYAFRSLYYRILKSLSTTPQYEHISGISLYDREVMNELLKIDYDFYFRFAIADMGYEVKMIPYQQQKRVHGKSSYNLLRYFSFAITSMVTTSTAPLRFMTISGMFCGFISFMLGIIYLIYKLIYWQRFQAGSAPLLIGFFFIGSVLLFSIGLLGEYIAVILRKVTHEPDVLLKETINIDEELIR